MKNIQASIVGAAGYAAGELIRLLINHPDVDLVSIQSNSQAGKKLSHVHTDLIGESNLSFDSKVETDSDCLFFCKGHGEAEEFFASHQLSQQTKIIDFSQDFRLKENNPTDQNFIYGLPELNREEIKQSQAVANPGCFATCIQLALLPLASMEKLTEDVHIHAITGATGAGIKPSGTSHFSWRNNNVSVYKAFQHQHLFEIRQSLQQLQSNFDGAINFIPVRGKFSRGIFASS